MNGKETYPALPNDLNLLKGFNPDYPPSNWTDNQQVRDFAAQLSRRSGFRIDPALLYKVIVKAVHFFSAPFDEAVAHIVGGVRGADDELLRQLSYFLRPGPRIIQVLSPPPRGGEIRGDQVIQNTGSSQQIHPEWDAKWIVGKVECSIETRRQFGKPLIQYRVGGTVMGEVQYISKSQEEFRYFDEGFRKHAEQKRWVDWFLDLAGKLGQSLD